MCAEIVTVNLEALLKNPWSRKSDFPRMTELSKVWDQSLVSVISEVQAKQ